MRGAAGLLLAACVTQAASQEHCKAGLPGVGNAVWLAASGAVPAHCQVTGVIGAHRGAPADTQYGNNFRLRIPQQWNGRFVFQGGGGNNGTVGDALGTLKNGALALAQGYAVAAQDSGHAGRDPSFALDRGAYLDFAHEGVHEVAQASKAILKAYAGKAPDYAYFVGCSNGGREAMVTAQRYQDFDGVVAGNPGNEIYDQWVHNMSVLRMVSRVAGVPAGVAPTDTSAAFSDAQLAHAADYFMRKCDRQDGAADGLMSNYQACKAEPADMAALQCGAAAHCLNPVQTEGLAELYRVFAPGSVEAGMRDIYLGVPGSAFPLGSFYKSIMANFYFMGYGFRGYPGLTGPADQLSSYPASSVPYVAGFDFATEPAKLAPGRRDFHGTEFDAFQKRGGKMLVYTGSADPAVQASGIMAQMDRIKRPEMARLFVVPGMTHCRGGNTVDGFDQLAPLAAWVERGIAPKRIEAHTAGRGRPLCAYPHYARYQGGPVDAAASHACVAPEGAKP